LGDFGGNLSNFLLQHLVTLSDRQTPLFSKAQKRLKPKKRRPFEKEVMLMIHK
jgi:hypothetical protein